MQNENLEGLIQKISEQAKIALQESPNAMLHYRLKTIISLAEEAIERVKTAQRPSAGGTASSACRTASEPP